MLRVGLLIIVTGIVTVGAAMAQRRFADGEDDRPRYYSARGRSMWPYEIRKVVRHAPGRAWINLNFSFDQGPNTTDLVQPKRDEWLELAFWSSVPIESLRVFDATRDRVLMAKDGDELLKCGRPGSGTTLFPRRYVICAINVPPNDTKLLIEVTDARVNEFHYVVQLPNYRLAHWDTDHK